MDNRTGFRRRGHGYLADQARNALGITGEVRVLAEIPLPMVHTAFGLAVVAAEVLLRPEAVGLNRSAAADAALAIVTGLVLVAYDLLIYPSDSRPGPVGTALPMAAVLSFGTLLAIAVLPLPIRITGGVIAAVVIGGVPQLAGRRALGKEGWFTRLTRDVSGIAVLAPVLIGGASPTLPLRLRLGAVVAVVFLVSLDSLRTERLSIRLTILFALLVASLVVGGAAVVGANSAHAGLRAAILLVLWYGARGVAGALGGPHRRRGLIAEYAVFVLAAMVGMVWINAAHF
ncbi:MAG TPA: hypothetical protein VND54_07520 [Candidatus Saccharimonadales bacterium]|nr:hypothetical protein [Candidatus Saccharimonadales bacterium]